MAAGALRCGCGAEFYGSGYAAADVEVSWCRRHARWANAVLVHGAVGELLPIFAISLLLSSRSPGMAFVVLLAFA